MASQPLETVVWESELIVVAKVTAVSLHGSEKSYATAKVVEVWRGTPPPAVEFLAEPACACDISEAQAGETVVLFLVRGQPSRSYLLDASGGGRMSLQVEHDIEFASASGYIILPDAFKTTPATKDGEYPRLVRLDTLREAVKAMLLTPPVPKA
ncbi:MAG: hypothetical protein M3Y80_06500 [Verrucomicrobiota bacterium]|nr:hypothetical protein [Verrucomicrobiota bacterium]